MKFLVLIIGMFFANAAFAKTDCSKHKLYCAIVKLKPRINKHFAMKLSNSIYKHSVRHGVDPYRAIAIMTQESGISMSARNSSTMTRSHKECDEWERCVTTNIVTTETDDFGLFQFNKATMKRSKLNIKKVMTNMDFTVGFAIRMIANKVKICSNKWPDTPWACYNSATNGLHQAYVKLVNNYYKRITLNVIKQNSQAQK